MKKLTNKIIDERLEKSNIRRVGNYTTAKFGTLVRCLECSYEWSPLMDHLCRGDKIAKCKKCTGHEPITLDYMNNIAKTYSGECLSLFTENGRRYVECKCKNKHTWAAILRNIIGGSWCRKCYDLERTQTIEDMQKLAALKGGKCISAIYDSNSLEWQCKEGHTWFANPARIKFGKWCKRCSVRKNEKLMIGILELYTTIQTQIRLSKIISTKEEFFVDCYLKDFNVIIEYNGDQHYKPVVFHSSQTIENAKEYFIKQQIRDKRLQYLCNENNITLIWIDGRKYKDIKLKNYLINTIIPLIKLFA